jgi:hypothetical protein
VQYEHTQHGVWHRILLLLAGLAVLGGWLVRRETPVAVLLLATAAIFLFCSLLFASLTVRDEVDRLSVRFGPLPLLGTTIRYADITSVERGRTNIIDGWGVHYILWRGWTYNLWGFDCVKLTLGKKIIRVGTDDAPALAEFLRTKMTSASSQD